MRKILSWYLARDPGGKFLTFSTCFFAKALRLSADKPIR
jgi:hypothetical protein